jgi:transposase, IS5 family
MAQPGFFDLDNRYESINKLSDPLKVLDQSIRWEKFRPELSKALPNSKK